MAYQNPSSGAYTDFSAYLRANPDEAPGLAQRIQSTALGAVDPSLSTQGQADALGGQIDTLSKPGAAASYLPGATAGERGMNTYLLGGADYLGPLRERYQGLLGQAWDERNAARGQPVIRQQPPAPGQSRPGRPQAQAQPAEAGAGAAWAGDPSQFGPDQEAESRRRAASRGTDWWSDGG